MNGLSEEQRLTVSAYCQKVLVWVEEVYYKKFDSNRLDLLNLYEETTPIIWNGYTMKGASGIQAALQQLPTTTHRIESIDCQPIHSTEADPSIRFILVTVNGTVNYAGEITYLFHQAFVVRAEGKDLKIVYDCYRWLATG
eukprot:RCo028485